MQGGVRNHKEMAHHDLLIFLYSLFILVLILWWSENTDIVVCDIIQDLQYKLF